MNAYANRMNKSCIVLCFNINPRSCWTRRNPWNFVVNVQKYILNMFSCAARKTLLEIVINLWFNCTNISHLFQRISKIYEKNIISKKIVAEALQYITNSTYNAPQFPNNNHIQQNILWLDMQIEHFSVNISFTKNSSRKFHFLLFSQKFFLKAAQ